MRKGLHAGASVVMVLCFLPLWGLQVYYWGVWWGPIGRYFGLGAIPVALLLPFIHLVKTGFFSYVLFGLLAAVITALVTLSITDPDRSR